MPTPDPAALAFLLRRRSCPAKTLTLPVPDRAQLRPILTAALRSPDHGKLEPWRLMVLERPALQRLGRLARARAAELGHDPERTDKGAGQFEQGNLAVAVIACPRAHDKIPEIEQTYSAGAVCLALLNAALASGWGANWLSGWPSHDAPFAARALGCAADERIAGFIHIGTTTTTPPERPRPDLDRVVTWISD